MAEDDNAALICAELPLECRGLEQLHRAAIDWVYGIAASGETRNRKLACQNSDVRGRNRSGIWSALSPRRFAFLKRKAARADTAGKLREAISRPGGATELSRWWSEAQPPGQVE
jgi:hypothetical protein